MSSFIAFLNHWWNLPFLVMLALVAIFFVLQLFGAVHHHHDAHVDHDHDVHHEHDAAHVQHDGAADFLAWLGVGRVPFMVVWVTLCVFAGFTGLILNRVFYLSGAMSGGMFVLSLGAALVVGLAGVRVFARAASRLVRLDERGATSKHELAGRAGIVASAVLDGRHGEVRVHDGAHEILVHGKLQAGETALKRGDKVVLVDYDAATELFWVTASPDSDAA
jgi:membrane protein implicated in regulation of membrane protease activity